MTLFKEKNNIAVILATFAFTMLGFLAAVITILFSFSKSKAISKYKRLGHLDVFFAIYYFSISCFVFTFATAILTLSSDTAAVWPMRLSLMFTVNNLAQVALLTFIIVNLCKRAMNE